MTLLIEHKLFADLLVPVECGPVVGHPLRLGQLRCPASLEALHSLHPLQRPERTRSPMELHRWGSRLMRPTVTVTASLA